MNLDAPFHPATWMALIFPLEDALLLRRAGLLENRSDRSTEVGRVIRLLMRKHPRLFRPEALAEMLSIGDSTGDL